MFTIAIATTVALLAGSVFAQDCGYAIVENKCDYDVYLFNVPASGGGQTQIQQVLSANDTYQQQWTELANGDGWSIKLSPTVDLTNIMQYEYTYHNDGIIWWDLSDVNGNPWNGNWMVEASNSDSCKPKQQAYCYSTDDAYGMQACPAEAHIKVTLCSKAEVGNDACDTSAAAATSYVSAAPTSYSAPAPTSYAPTTTSAVLSAASSSIFTTASQSAPAWMSPNTFYAVTSTSEEASAETPTSTFVSATTFATSSVAIISQAPGVTITEIDTDVVTDIVTATAYGKRHEHHPRHPHHRHA